MMESSYQKNNYGEVFSFIVDAFKPVNCVELGVLNGYSAFHIGAQLRKIGRGRLQVYDLFEDYPYRHSSEADVRELFKNCDNVEIFKRDAFTVADLYQDRTVDFIHVDLSNTGDIVRKIMEQWDQKMVQGGVVLFEGGSEERDCMEWMNKYSKEPIKPEVENNPIIRANYIFGTYLKFPSLTMLLKKR